jgi:hypothetical protein
MKVKKTSESNQVNSLAPRLWAYDCDNQIEKKVNKKSQR